MTRNVRVGVIRGRITLFLPKDPSDITFKTSCVFSNQAFAVVALVIGTGPLINSSITERPNSGIRIESSFLASTAAAGFVFLESFNFLRDSPALSHIAIVSGLSK